MGVVMNDRIEAGKIAGIPIEVHFTYIVLLIIWGQHGLTSGDGPRIISTLVILAALTGSILLHEFGHAFAGRLFGMRVSHIDLNGCGGACHYAGGSVRDRAQELTVILAGPLANLLIYACCQGLENCLYPLVSDTNDNAALFWLIGTISMIGSANFSLFWFNLLPAHPLDGGKIATIILRGRTDDVTAQTAVAWAGIAVAALLIASCGPRGSGFCVAVALMIGFENAQILMQGGRPPWQRWN